MRELHQILDKMIKGLPQQFLEKAITEKLTKAKINISQHDVAKAAKRIIAGTANAFKFKDESGAKHTVSMTSAELDEVLKALNEFVEHKLPEVTEQTANSTVGIILKTLRRKWRGEWKRQEEEMVQFRANLEKRWGKALGLIRMMLTISREWGQNIFERKRDAKNGKMTIFDDVMLRLHVRACQITSEIIVLLENGYADGAMARWRSLHEVSTVALVIAKFGEEMAIRYSEHQVVEAVKALNAYEASYEELGYEAIDPKEAAKIRSDCAEILLKHGKSFNGDYGWAAHSLGKESVTFAMLQEAADQKRMRSYYRMASYNVHAGPKGIYFRLAGMNDPGLMIAGASNAGLFEPTQNAALSLSKATAAMGSPPYNTETAFGDIVYSKIIAKLVEQVPEELIKASEQLQKDAERYGSTFSM